MLVTMQGVKLVALLKKKCSDVLITVSLTVLPALWMCALRVAVEWPAWL